MDEPWGPNHPDWKLKDEEEAAWRLAHPGQSYEDYREGDINEQDQDGEPLEGYMPFADDESGNDPDEVDPGVDRTTWADIQRQESPYDEDDDPWIVGVNPLGGQLFFCGPFTEAEARAFGDRLGREGSDWWLTRLWKVK